MKETGCSPVGAKYISPGRESWGAGPRPAYGTPLPPGRERGRGRGKVSLTHGLRHGLLSFARFAGLTYVTNHCDRRLGIKSCLRYPKRFLGVAP